MDDTFQRDLVDARADQYSPGCVLYEMLTGTPWFAGTSAQSIIALEGAASPRSAMLRYSFDTAAALQRLAGEPRSAP